MRRGLEQEMSKCSMALQVVLTVTLFNTGEVNFLMQK